MRFFCYKHDYHGVHYYFQLSIVILIILCVICLCMLQFLTQKEKTQQLWTVHCVNTFSLNYHDNYLNECITLVIQCFHIIVFNHIFSFLFSFIENSVLMLGFKLPTLISTQYLFSDQIEEWVIWKMYKLTRT